MNAVREYRPPARSHAEDYRRLKLRWKFWSAFAFGIFGVLLLLDGAPRLTVSVFFGMALAEMCRYLLESGHVRSDGRKRALSVSVWVIRGAVLCVVIAYFNQ